MEDRQILTYDFHNWLESWLLDAGISPESLPYVELLILFTGLVILCMLVYYITKRVVVNMINAVIRKTRISWDDQLVEQRVFEKAAHFLPAMLLKWLAPVVFADFQNLQPFVSRITDAYIIIVMVMIFMAFVRVGERMAIGSAAFKDKPVNSYFQLLRIIIYIAAGILVLSALLGKSPIYFLSAFGAMTAIILLIFKDTILGLVASVQLSSNDMVRVGDWVEMPKYNADGDVVAMTLHTVKVQNWDKTITTIPSYYFITDSFKNYRGMVESGGRRIKRAIYLNINSVKFVDQALKDRFLKFHRVSDYINERQKEIDAYNQSMGFDNGELINGRRMTNIGVFRRYVLSYLKNQKRIRQDMTQLVRQLEPTETGLPLEIYCFTATTAWAEYEEIQSDIFDHLIAATRHFDLEIFQSPSGNDISGAAQMLWKVRE